MNKECILETGKGEKKKKNGGLKRKKRENRGRKMQWGETLGGILFLLAT